jgi:hypothetical protein
MSWPEPYASHPSGFAFTGAFALIIQVGPTVRVG